MVARMRNRTATWVNLVFVVLISGLVAFWGYWKWAGLSAFLIVLGTVQIFLSPPDEDPAGGWVHGLHGLFALFVLALAAVIANNDLRLLGLKRGAPLPAEAPPPPA
jgi:hypothetical protein